MKKTSTSHKRVGLRDLMRHKTAMLGALIALALALTALFAEVLAPHDPTFVYKSANRKPPGYTMEKDQFEDEIYGLDFRKCSVFKSLLPREDDMTYLKPRTRKFILGTDSLGRDILSRIIYGARVSLIIGFAAEAIAIFIGVIVGTIAGYFKGFVDSVLMRITDTFYAFPSLLLAIGILAVFEKPGLPHIFFALGLVSWTPIARVIRGQVLTIRQMDFVQSARAAGANPARIMIKHLIPNAMSPIIVLGTLGVAENILSEAGLSFLGLGVQPPNPSWGGMLSDAADLIGYMDWLAISPGVAIMLTVLGINLFGDGLRDILDPKLDAK